MQFHLTVVSIFLKICVKDLQNQVSARRLELNKIIFRQIAPTLYDLVVLKD